MEAVQRGDTTSKIWLVGRESSSLSSICGDIPMKGLSIAAVIMVVLYFADQHYASGMYLNALQQLAAQIRHSFRL